MAASDEEIAKLAVVLHNAEASAQELLEAVTTVRKLLSIERDPPIDAVLRANIAPRLVEILAEDDKPTLQFEAGWALTNIASGTSTHARILIDLGIIPAFQRLLASPSADVVEQVVWGLGNLAGDCAAVRDLVLDANVLPALAEACTRVEKLTFTRNCAWLVSNLNRGKPQPHLPQVRPSLELMIRWVYSTDDEVVTDALWGMSYLCDGPNERIALLVESGVLSRVVELLGHTNYAVVTPALRTVGNIVTGDDLHTQAALNAGLLPRLRPLLSATKNGVRKETCWTVSNITAGTKDQIQAVMDAQLMETVIELCMRDQQDIRKEACWAISNTTSGGTPEQIATLVSIGCVPALANALKSADGRERDVAIEALANIAECEEAVEMGAGPQLAEAGVQEFLESIGDLESRADYDKIQRILSIIDSDVMSILVKPAHQIGSMRAAEGSDDDGAESAGEADDDEEDDDDDGGDGGMKRGEGEKKRGKQVQKEEAAAVETTEAAKGAAAATTKDDKEEKEVEAPAADTTKLEV